MPMMTEDISFEKLKVLADNNYDMVGEVVDEDANQITLIKHNHLLCDVVGVAIEQVLSEHPLPYQLQDFQKLSLHALGSQKNVILISPTGSGKMIIAYLAVHGRHFILRWILINNCQTPLRTCRPDPTLVGRSRH